MKLGVIVACLAIAGLVLATENWRRAEKSKAEAQMVHDCISEGKVVHRSFVLGRISCKEPRHHRGEQ